MEFSWSTALLLLTAACAKPPVSDHGPGPEPDPDAASTTQPGPVDAPPGPDAPPDDDDGLVWRDANLTMFTSYPDPGSEECEEFNGCKWAGRFEFVDGQQTEAWVMDHNIAAVHSDDGAMYGLKTLRVRSDSNQIDVTVYDVCADSDCDGCCTQNSAETGFLIDLESYTSERFGMEDGIVEFACLDCD
jgi:hypothetical protein